MTSETGAFEYSRAICRIRADLATAIGLSACACFCLLAERWPSMELSAQNVVASSAQAHGYKRATLEILHPWTSVKAEAGETEAAVGMSIRNFGKADERLIGAHSAIADKVEIRLAGSETPVKSDSRTSRIAVPSQHEVHLKPSAAHVRLIGLRKRLVTYDTLPITLHFEKAGSVDVDVLVEEALE